MQPVATTLPPTPAENEMQTLAARFAKPEIVNDVYTGPRLLLPAGYSTVDLEAQLVQPRRVRGFVRIDDQESFIGYVSSYKAGDSARVFCSANFATGAVVFKAALNWTPSLNVPQWGDFGAVYKPDHSEEWKRWKGNEKKEMSQIAFAAFIEENLRDIAAATGMPSGTQMLALATSLEIANDARFKSSIRLQSGGVELLYVDKDDDETQKRMSLYERFALGVPVFLNGPPYQINARLRYRVRDGAVTFWYELIRADIVVQDAVKTMVAEITQGIGSPVVYGWPDANATRP